MNGVSHTQASDEMLQGEALRGPQPVRGVLTLAFRLVWEWWPHVVVLAVACGVVAATITGAIGVGDAMQAGLRRLAIGRLGQIDSAVLGDDFFRATLAREMVATDALPIDPRSGLHSIPPATLVPAIVLEVTVDVAKGGLSPQHSGRATLLACNELDSLGYAVESHAALTDQDQTVAMNAVLAESLGVRVGDAIVLRIPKRSAVPSDSPLGRRTPDSTGKRLLVSQILPREGLGQFALRPTQVTGPLVVASLSTAQQILRRGDVANAIFAVASLPAGPPAHPSVVSWLASGLHPLMEDIGLCLEPVEASEALRLTSRRLIMPPEVDRVAEQLLWPLGGRPSLAFLANSLEPVDQGDRAIAATIPYSTIVGISSGSLPVGDLVDQRGGILKTPEADEIVINRWMADDFASQGNPIAIGDSLEIRLFRPETLHGRVEETRCTLRVSGVAEMRGAAVARSLVPEVEGITDERSIADWDPPFPFNRQAVRTTPPNDQDDRYWKEYGATPKAFVSLEVARRLAGSRFGQSTAWHVPNPHGGSLDGLRHTIAAAIQPEPMGLRVVPLKALALRAAEGSTPFGSLFLALSSFVVVAGLLLEWLLFNLMVAARRRDIGILAAIGWPPGQVAKLLTLIGGIAAVAGIAIGTFLGPLWSSLLLACLATSWNNAVAAGSIQAFGADAPSLAALWPSAAGSLIVSLAAVAWAARRMAHRSPSTLLRGGCDCVRGVHGVHGVRGKTGSQSRQPICVAIVAAVGVLASAWGARSGEAQSAVVFFFLSGAAALVGLLAVVRFVLDRAGLNRLALRTLPQLAWRGIKAQPSRAFSVVAIVGIAEFLVVALSSFSLPVPDQPQSTQSPTGGYTFIATFGEPTGIDPSSNATQESVQESLGLTDDQRAVLASCTIARLRSNAGDDASCTNLYAPGQPTVLGLGPEFVSRGGFRFVEHAAIEPDSEDLPPNASPNPWTLLDRPLPTQAADTRPIPAILDQATAQWALKLGGVGSGFTVADDDGKKVDLEIVGLLEPSILQGYVLVSENNFERIFPRRSGYAMAMIDGAAAMAPLGADVRSHSRHLTQAIAAAWADAGVSVESTLERFRSLSAVQNTFLAGFQALGTLGLLLGTVGVAAVQAQSVLERTAAIGLMRAIGFTLFRIRSIVVLETLLMVGLGLAVGTLSGCLALVPSLVAGVARVPLAWILATSGLTMAASLVAGIVATGQIARLESRESLRSL